MSDILTSYEREQRRQTLAVSVVVVLLGAIALGLYNIQFQGWISKTALVALAIICFPVFWLNARGHYVPAATLLSVAVLMTLNLNVFDGDGLRDPGVVAYPMFVIVGALFFGKRSALGFFLATAVSLTAITILDIQGYVHRPIGATDFSLLVPFLIFLGISSLIIWVIMGNAEKNLENIKRSEFKILQAYETTLEGWSKALEYRNKETEGHSRRVAALSTQLAQALGCTEEEITQIRRGALLHDIGKLAVPDLILLKPGALDEKERNIVQQHPIVAKEILSQVEFLQRAMDIPYSHHERWDGSGYPRGLKGEAIPLAARLFAVIDCWDALGSERPYRQAWARDDIIAYMKEGAGKIFDPKIVDVFLRLV